MDELSTSGLARTGVLVTLAALMAACGGGGDNAGVCSGSAEVCGRAPVFTPAPGPAAPAPPPAGCGGEGQPPC